VLPRGSVEELGAPCKGERDFWGTFPEIRVGAGSQMTALLLSSLLHVRPPGDIATVTKLDVNFSGRPVGGRIAPIPRLSCDR
jgi:hypothetical protein